MAAETLKNLLPGRRRKSGETAKPFTAHIDETGKPVVPDCYKKGWKPPFQKQDKTEGDLGAPGLTRLMDPIPLDDITSDGRRYKAAGKMDGYCTIVTGGDSGIGRSVAVLFALEGAHVTIAYLPHDEEDAQSTKAYIAEKAPKSRIELFPADLRNEENCKLLIQKHMETFNRIDSLIINHAGQRGQPDIEHIPADQWRDTFDTNVHSYFYISKAAMEHMKDGSSITMTASINAAIGYPKLIDYSATKGALYSYMRALSNSVIESKGIRVNAVAPGPIWTPLIPGSMLNDDFWKFGDMVPIKRIAQPVEVATTYVFLSGPDASYITGQVFHVNGGVVIN